MVLGVGTISGSLADLWRVFQKLMQMQNQYVTVEILHLRQKLFLLVKALNGTNRI